MSIRSIQGFTFECTEGTEPPMVRIENESGESGDILDIPWEALRAFVQEESIERIVVCAEKFLEKLALEDPDTAVELHKIATELGIPIKGMDESPAGCFKDLGAEVKDMSEKPEFFDEEGGV